MAYNVTADKQAGYWNVETDHGFTLHLTTSELFTLGKLPGINFVFTVPEPRDPIVIEATDSHITHECGAIVSVHFLSDGPTQCPYCGKYVTQ